jgi:hypothetical protein
MSEQSPAPGADQTQPAAETVPVAALAAMQDALAANAAQMEALKKQLADSNAALAAQEDVKAASEKQAAAAEEALSAALAANAALKAAKEAAEVRAEAAGKDANFARASSKARFRIMIDEGRDKSDPDPVPVGANGRVYQIKRMRKVDVPQEVVSILNDAVLGRAEPIVDERTGIASGVEFRPARRFPFSELGQSYDDDGNLMPGVEPLPA